MIEQTFLGCAPVGLLEKSREHAQHFLYFGCTHYDEYVMVDGVSRFSGSVDYAKVTLQ
jgi:hypothetical protein